MTFSPDWLALREPADHASRNPELLARAASVAGPNAVVADLGSGTGSTARAFDDPVCADWTWRFVDGDRGLLEIAKTRHPTSQQREIDLKDIETLGLDDVNLVTASALLDLMSRDWVCQLAVKLGAVAVPFYAAINYNGIMHWSRPHEQDTAVTAAFNTHQRRDKGIGPALGPDSVSETVRVFEENGFDVHIGNSPWTLGPDQTALHRATLTGIAEAAGEIGNAAAADWAEARRSSADRSTGYIGHVDILAMPRASGLAGE